MSVSGNRRKVLCLTDIGEFDRIFQFCEEYGTTEDDVLVILGDAGINYYCDLRDGELKSELSLLPILLLCIHGNHEERPFELGYDYGDKI